MIASPPAPIRWRVAAEPLQDWRDDDPDALPRCSVNAQHIIRNGDRYAISGNLVACVPCSQLKLKLTPAPVALPAPTAPRPPDMNRAAQQFGGMRPAREKAVVRQMRAPARASTPASRPRPMLGPAHPGYGKPIKEQAARPPREPRPPKPPRVERVRFREERTCALASCGKTFIATASTRKQRYCDLACATQASANARQTASADVQAETRTCEADGCTTTFTVERWRPDRRFCSVPCARRAPRRSSDEIGAERIVLVALPVAEVVPVEVEAPAPADELHGCPCFEHASERARLGIAPLPARIGAHVFTALRAGER